MGLLETGGEVELKGIEPSASRVRFWRSPKLSYSPEILHERI